MSWHRFERRIVGQDSVSKWYLSQANLVKDPHTLEPSVVVVQVDVTAAKQVLMDSVVHRSAKQRMECCLATKKSNVSTFCPIQMQQTSSAREDCLSEQLQTSQRRLLSLVAANERLKGVAEELQDTVTLLHQQLKMAGVKLTEDLDRVVKNSMSATLLTADGDIPSFEQDLGLDFELLAADTPFGDTADKGKMHEEKHIQMKAGYDVMHAIEDSGVPMYSIPTASSPGASPHLARMVRRRSVLGFAAAGVPDHALQQQVEDMKTQYQKVY